MTAIDVRRVLGFGALFSGVALLGLILAKISLPLTLTVTGAGFVVALVIAMSRMGPERRQWLRKVLVAGVVTGLVATFVYDVSRTVLSQLDPSPYSPFEVLRIFGTLFIGEEAPRDQQFAVGAVYHLLNGTTFGLSYVLLFGRDGRTSNRWALGTGLVWGLFLEGFQITLYPTWLNIIFLKEFVVISAFSHAFFGLTLGICGRWMLRRSVPEGLDEDDDDEDTALPEPGTADPPLAAP